MNNNETIFQPNIVCIGSVYFIRMLDVVAAFLEPSSHRYTHSIYEYNLYMDGWMELYVDLLRLGTTTLHVGLL